jgi:hypothetical protein
MSSVRKHISKLAIMSFLLALLGSVSLILVSHSLTLAQISLAIIIVALVLNLIAIATTQKAKDFLGLFFAMVGTLVAGISLIVIIIVMTLYSG